jgi:hypothetical protein
MVPYYIGLSIWMVMVIPEVVVVRQGMRGVSMGQNDCKSGGEVRRNALLQCPFAELHKADVFCLLVGRGNYAEPPLSEIPVQSIDVGSGKVR